MTATGLPLTPLQESHLRQVRRGAGQGTQIMPPHCLGACLRVRGAVSDMALERAAAAVTHRHEALRAHLSSVGTDARQVIVPRVAPVAHLGDIEPGGEGIRRVFVDWCRFEFDPLLPMFEIGMATAGKRETVLLIRADQLVSDLWSMNIVVDELIKDYGAVLGRCDPPEFPRTGYAQVVLRDSAWLSSAPGLALREGAARLAAAAEPVPLPMPAGGAPRGVFAERSWTMSSDLAAACAGNPRTVTAVCAAALGAAVGRALSAASVPVLIVFSGRETPDLNSLVMWRSSMLPVPVPSTLGAGRPTHDLVRQVQETYFRALECQRVPWPVAMKDSGMSWQADGRPPIDIVMQYVPRTLGKFFTDGDLKPFE